MQRTNLYIQYQCMLQYTPVHEYQRETCRYYPDLDIHLTWIRTEPWYTELLRTWSRPRLENPVLLYTSAVDPPHMAKPSGWMWLITEYSVGTWRVHMICYDMIWWGISVYTRCLVDVRRWYYWPEGTRQWHLNFETACRCQIETAEVLCLVWCIMYNYTKVYSVWC